MRGFLFAALAVLSAGPALASQCPTMWHEIDDKIRSAQLSEAEAADIVEHRKRGEELHNTGKHAESEAALNAALLALNRTGLF